MRRELDTEDRQRGEAAGSPPRPTPHMQVPDRHPGSGRAFRRKAARFWETWPMPPKAERPRRVIYVDGIHLGRRAAVLIASDDDHVLGWHLTRSENSRARASPMGRMAAPEVVMSNGETASRRRCPLRRCCARCPRTPQPRPSMRGLPPRETRRNRSSMGRRHRVVRASSCRAISHGQGLTGHAFCPLAPNQGQPRGERLDTRFDRWRNTRATVEVWKQAS